MHVMSAPQVSYFGAFIFSPMSLSITLCLCLNLSPSLSLYLSTYLLIYMCVSMCAHICMYIVLKNMVFFKHSTYLWLLSQVNKYPLTT